MLYLSFNLHEALNGVVLSLSGKFGSPVAHRRYLLATEVSGQAKGRKCCDCHPHSGKCFNHKITKIELSASVDDFLAIRDSRQHEPAADSVSFTFFIHRLASTQSRMRLGSC